ncbi:hypothetical protein ADK76_18485 [Streptomyces griseoflavus]|nr:hypothetical protein ADK76_18485 [Streptomyces griseoflavus]
MALDFGLRTAAARKRLNEWDLAAEVGLVGVPGLGGDRDQRRRGGMRRRAVARIRAVAGSKRNSWAAVLGDGAVCSRERRTRWRLLQPARSAGASIRNAPAVAARGDAMTMSQRGPAAVPVPYRQPAHPHGQ